jgi:hypothetical protein
MPGNMGVNIPVVSVSEPVKIGVVRIFQFDLVAIVLA